MCQDSAVSAVVENHAEAGLDVLAHDHAGRVHAARFQVFQHEAAEHVVAHDAAVCHAQTQARAAARKDDAGTAQGQRGVVDELLGLAKDGRGAIAQD